MEAMSLFSHILIGGAGMGAALYTIGADLLATYGRGTVRRGPNERQAVALTFDDGPDPVFTPHILATLEQFGARATFFVIGKQAEQHPEIIRALANAGHEVGHHTYGHRPLWLLTPRQTREEIERGTHVLAAILGRPPQYFRPPWGHFNLEAMRHSNRLQQRRMLWSLRAEGWLSLASPQTMVRTIVQRLHPGAIINLHDGGGLRHTPARTAAALPSILRLIHERGYRCLTLSELLTARPTTRSLATLSSRVWDWYECAWNAWYRVEKLGPASILTLGPAIHNGPRLILYDGAMIHPGAHVGELHLDRARLGELHRTVARQHVGLALRRELESTLQRLAQLVVEQPRYHRFEAFRSTTLFWKETTRLGFETCAPDTDWRHRFLGWYQRMLLRRDHPLGCGRLQGRRWEARTIWLSRQELLRRYGRPGR
jgi:peptidoglycan/xylan/chitin deacetylase (PgdA/CDA1 family)